jgi:epoxyqueuosine reductase
VNFLDRLLCAAKAHQFPLAGALDIDTVLSQQGDFHDHLKRFDSWLDRGYAGEMGYLKRGRDRRADPRLVFPEAQSILCVAIPYERLATGALDQSGPRYARYLRGHDYHEIIAQRLERLMAELAKELPELAWKVCVDTSAILERSWATLTGLGWIGKNTTLIHPKFGSYLFLGEVLINKKVDQGPSPLPNYCGSCTRCLEGCPTQAFSAPGTLNSNRCISYWTLEKRGALELSKEDQAAIGRWVAGCDICQEVCPFNLKPSREVIEGIDPLFPYTSQSDSTRLNSWSELLQETELQYAQRVKESALNRVKPAQFSRNLAIAFSNAIATIPKDELRKIRPLVEFRANQGEWKSVLEKVDNQLLSS